MIRIAVLVSGGGTNLQALIDYEKAGNNPHGKISLVLASNSKAYALERAHQADIPTAVVRRKDYESQEAFDHAVTVTLQENRIDLVILAGFLSILGPEVIQAYPERIINIHPSLIPSFCGKGFYGLKVHEAALAKGVKVSGATVHFVNEIPDGGILQKRIMEEAEWVLLPQAMKQLSEALDQEESI